MMELNKFIFRTQMGIGLKLITLGRSTAVFNVIFPEISFLSRRLVDCIKLVVKGVFFTRNTNNILIYFSKL